MRSELMLDIHRSALCYRHRFTVDPAPVIDELRRVAGGSTRVLASTVGHWVGFYEHPTIATLTGALRSAFPECEASIGAGDAQRARPAHGTGDYKAGAAN